MSATRNESSLQVCAQFFNVLADPARLRILNLLRARSEICSCEIGPVTGYIPSKISRHLSLLRQAGLLQERRDGTFIHYRLINSSDPLIQQTLALVDLIALTDPCLQGDRLAVTDRADEVDNEPDLAYNPLPTNLL